ncbi:regulatory protein YeiL [Clostridium homopropionicum DSM 5847]|uniref:Regulatory protein YeiL n=1 Tax=Clostridium homopropionicum DSM 5847 TaxID=1121318 RepID=A0A0L6Z8W9_9CLOT|nr:cyclic nucleotide-binding domain-containing protein [Clostridium homopropionicum]KOA19414.1 regulatory protein YeiL [Clostridium homopropionicum DSM 5847]SFG69057.1 cAMP-binding domain of CRP or a regulatory subunit of cAMP-dependent protein kinases [Clostridium homopropionicum]
MEKIDGLRLMEIYISKYNINEIFTYDMKQFMELIIFKKNEYICRDGEVIEYLFFFVKGKAKVYTTLSNGKSLLLCFYENFKILGDLEIIDCETASTNVQVIEESLCIGISKENVNKYLLTDSKFLRFICSSLSSKLNRCSKNSSINLLYPLENRLASYILATAEKKDNNSKENIVLNGNLTEISELLGTSYRHLLRTINTLCIKGIIRKRDNYYEIIDEMSLRKLASDLYMA